MKTIFLRRFILISISVIGIFIYFQSYSQCVNCYDCYSNSSYRSSAIGQNDTASGYYSFASGLYSRARNQNSIAMGSYNVSSGDYSITLGGNLRATSNNNILIGFGYNNTPGSTLVNNIPYSMMIGFSSIYPTFFISRSEAYYKTGKIGIGNVTNPLAKLHIRSDTDEPASLFLEPSNWTAEYNAELFLGNLSHGISADIDKGMVFRTENFYLFNQGNMGIGTEDPSAKIHVKSGDIYIEDIDRGIIMKSPDGTCWRGTVNNQGQLIFASLDECPENSTVSIKEPISNKMEIQIRPNPAENNIEIEIPGIGSKEIDFIIVDENGKNVKSLKLTSIKTTVNIADLAPGLYFGKYTGEQVYFVEKIIKL